MSTYRPACVAALGFALFLVTSWVQAQSSDPDQNLVARVARNSGVKQCSAPLARMTALTLVGAKAHEVLFDLDRDQPDKMPFLSLIGMSLPVGGAVASVLAVPKEGGGCVISAERFSAAPYTCDSIAEVELKGYDVHTLLPGFKVYTSGADPKSTVSLIESIPNCLVIRRYVDFNWKPADPNSAAPVVR